MSSKNNYTNHVIYFRLQTTDYRLQTTDYRRYKLNSQAVLANSLVYFFILTLFLGISISASAQNRAKQRRVQLFQMKAENTEVSAAESFALQVLKSSKKTKHITHVFLPENLYQYTEFVLYFDLKVERIVDQNYPNAIELIVQRTDVHVIEGEVGYSWLGSIKSTHAKYAIWHLYSSYGC